MNVYKRFNVEIGKHRIPLAGFSVIMQSGFLNFLFYSTIVWSFALQILESKIYYKWMFTSDLYKKHFVLLLLGISSASVCFKLLYLGLLFCTLSGGTALAKLEPSIWCELTAPTAASAFAVIWTSDCWLCSWLS